MLHFKGDGNTKCKSHDVCHTRGLDAVARFDNFYKIFMSAHLKKNEFIVTCAVCRLGIPLPKLSMSCFPGGIDPRV